MTSKLDISKAAPHIATVQKEMENEVATIYRQAQMSLYQRIWVAGYQQAERDYNVFKADGNTLIDAGSKQ